MRIGIYKDTLANKRGADVAVTLLADGLKERGHDAVLFEKNELDGRLGETWDAIISAGTNELLDLSGRTAAPVIQQFHTNPESQFKWKRFLRNRRIRRALRLVTAIQVLREEHAAQMLRYGVKVATIGNWSTYDDADTSVPSGRDIETRTILYPAAFSKSKNHKLLLKAFSSLRNEFPDWTLELYGGGTFSGKIPANVKIMPHGDLREAYARCAFLAFPSLDEGFGLVIAEAASFSKPAVALHDWIGTAGAGGAVIAPANAKNYAQALARLMRDARLRRQLGEKARIYCRKTYSRDNILDAWEKLILSSIRKSI